ncbi:MAG: dynamin family protein [Paracoccaceae bacterium]|nr:dynamin family protein [Paracoccaceae bacterium]
MVQNAHLLSAGNAAVEGATESFAKLSKRLDQLASVTDQRTAARAAALRGRLQEFAAKVTLVGQVKAGKSALTNVLAGSPGLLPSDVNPWTSVVTTLMINTKAPADTSSTDTTKAQFTFFDKNEWSNLVIGGGRLGELAERAGASEEMQDIQKQIEAMRKATEKRLGKHFELLLGQSHSYGYVDTELMERYVCLGDDPDMGDVSAKTGRFADITKSADLYLDIPAYAMPIQLCDTPGVNDTFMMREQITIRSLRGSEICVVVLSAHQALTTTDMALMRIISTLDKRQTIIFVNRVDELSAPADQIPEIRDGIFKTLKDNRIDAEVSVIFGSAKWAEAALLGHFDEMSSDSKACLDAYIEAEPELAKMDIVDGTWAASGLPALLTSIGERISEGSAQRLYSRVCRSARNLTNEARATMIARRSGEFAKTDIPGGDPVQAIDEIAKRYALQVEEVTKELRADLLARMETAQAGFVKRATDSLIAYLEKFGEQGTWNYDPAGLRVLQRAAFSNFSRSVRSKTSKVYDEAAASVEAVYRSVLGDSLPDFQIEAPHPPMVPPPVGLGKTIALDLQSSWWRTWWQKRRGFEAFANDYAHLIRAEAASIVQDLEGVQAAAVLQNIRTTFSTFMSEHQETIRRLQKEGDLGAAEAKDALESIQSTDAQTIFGEILRDLEDEAA